MAHQREEELYLVHQLAKAVSEAGGTLYFVGGYVRDRLLGRENKDLDVEVHGLVPEEFLKILERFGTPLTKGESFGVYGLHGYSMDVAMPRRERATGAGHRDFWVDVDPFLGLEQTARRRDFTINAMMQEVLTGKVWDFFGGQVDLKRRLIRQIDSVRFAEDPLRVLRGAQFAARFEYSVTEDTICTMRQMDLSSLARERVWGELQKALVKARQSSLFFWTLRRADQLSCWFPELKALIGVQQNPRFHPEGDVWNHTMLVLDRAAALREEADHPQSFLLTALLHDLGKITATTCENGQIRSIGHEKEGAPLIQSFLDRVVPVHALHREVQNLSLLHMRPNQLAAQHAGVKATNNLFDEAIAPKDLVLFAKADHEGRPYAVWSASTANYLWERLRQYQQTMAKPAVCGKDLVEAGLSPGPWFSDLLSYARRLQLSNVDQKQVLSQVLAYARRIKQQEASNVHEQNDG